MSNRNYGLVKSEEDLDRFVDKLLSSDKPFAFDIETGYTGFLRAKGALQHYASDYVVAGISFTNNSDWARYAPLDHEMGDPGKSLNNLDAARSLWRLLSSGKGIPHNGLMELSGMGRFFRDNLWDDDTIIPGTDKTFRNEVRREDGLYPILSDTMIESMLCAEHKRKGLKDLSHDILGVNQVELITLFRDRKLKGQKADGKFVLYNTTNLRFNVLPLDPDVVAYACEDSALTLDHHERTYTEVKDLLVFKTEIRLIPILVRMEKEGMFLDWAEYERRSREITMFRDQYAEYVMDVFSGIAGELININLNAPKQVADVLFNKMGIKPTTYTDTGQASTSEKAMRMLLAKHPEIKSLLQYREVAKLLGSYIDKYLNELRYDPSGRVHPSHNTGGTVTGRFSVDGVSYQQWPKPYHYELPSGSTLDLNYRNFLISPEDYRIIGFDYANVELRIVAGLANERAMLDAFAKGIDIHKATASTMLKIPLEDVTDKQRSVGKTLNFAIVYGSGADNIATLITAATGELCTVEEAEGYLANYFKAFPDLKAWMDDRVLEGHFVHEKPRESYPAHRVTTAFGRRIPIIEYESEYKNVRNKGDRNAVNGPVQGAAADYMKIGMVRADAAIRKAEKEGRIAKDSIRLIMTIHDALEFYVHKSVDTRTVIDILEPAVSFNVTKTWDGQDLTLPVIRADWHEGYRWGSVAEIEQDAEGKIIYHRKLELADKTKHNFVADSLDELVADIDKFWTERESSELDARVLEELDFEYDKDEDEFIVPDHSNIGESLKTGLLGAKVDQKELFTAEDIEAGERAALGETLPEHLEHRDDIPEETKTALLENRNAKFSLLDPPVNAIDDAKDRIDAKDVSSVVIEEDEPPWLHGHDYEEPKVNQLRLSLFQMPTTDNWPKFKTWLAAHPGSDTLVISMPQGEITIENVAVSPQHQTEFQLIFSEATLAIDESEAIVDKVMEGIEL